MGLLIPRPSGQEVLSDEAQACSSGEAMTTQATAEAVYDQIIKPLPASERLRLATMILNGIPPQSVVDYSEEWSEEDMREFTAASWNYVLQRLEEEEGDAPAG